MPAPLILGLGEILWDELPAGRQLGGAPANFAWHAAQLGADARIVSAVGDDANGAAILELVAGKGLDTRLIAVRPGVPTGTVAVQLDGRGKPTYTIREGVAWDGFAVTDAALDAARQAAAVCFGSLAQRTPAGRGALQTLVRAAPPFALRLFDINLRQHYWERETLEQSLALATVLKLNDEELPVLAREFGLRGSAGDQLAELARRFELQTVALTRGAAGSAIWREGALHEAPGTPVAVVDTVGAGDAYGAALVMGLLANLPTDRLIDLCQRVGAYVCTRPGAMPPLPLRLRLALTREATPAVGVASRVR